MPRLEISTFAQFFFPTTTVWMNCGSQEEITVLPIYQSFHHLLQLQWYGNKHLVQTGFEPVQQALASCGNFPSYELTVQKRGSWPVHSANHIPEFSYDEELQTRKSFEEMEGSREEMELASNDDSFWGAEILQDGVSMTQPPGTSSRARLSPAHRLRSCSSRDCVTQ